jgi:hypothetical protein
MNKSRNKLNQPPSGQGKKQSPKLGRNNKLNKRSEVLQASDARQNIGSAEDEASSSATDKRNPHRPKAGR